MCFKVPAGQYEQRTQNLKTTVFYSHGMCRMRILKRCFENYKFARLGKARLKIALYITNDRLLPHCSRGSELQTGNQP